MSLVKTAELDPSKGYVFGFHPHGIISMSAFIAFATEGLNVSKVFPGEQAHQSRLVVPALCLSLSRNRLNNSRKEEVMFGPYCCGGLF